MAILSKDHFSAARSSNGGWSNTQLKALGVPFPLKHGWRERILGTEVPDRRIADFIALKNYHLGSSGWKPTMWKPGTEKPSNRRKKSKSIPSPSYAIPFTPVNADDIEAIEYRARWLVDGEGSSGSKTTTCKEAKCSFPCCLC